MKFLNRVFLNKGKVINLKTTSRTTADCVVALDVTKTIKVEALFGNKFNHLIKLNNLA